MAIAPFLGGPVKSFSAPVLEAALVEAAWEGIQDLDGRSPW
jgi:hypothetical protein